MNLITATAAQTAQHALNQGMQEVNHQLALNEIQQTHRRQQEFDHMQELLKTNTRSASAAKDVIR